LSPEQGKGVDIEGLTSIVSAVKSIHISILLTQPMTIEIGKAAIAEIERMRSIRQQPTHKLRISVLPGGCEHWHYQIDLTEVVTEDDLKYSIAGVDVAIAPEHLPYIENLRLDYSEDLMGGAFQFQNPAATKICDCGNSFST
jgi:iron-sulfur cluster assembly protein